MPAVMSGRAIAGLDPANAERLARLLGMLGSAHDGEIANAGRMADKLVRSLGLTWHDLIHCGTPQRRQVATRSTGAWREPQDLGEAILVARRYARQLTVWENEFVRGLAGFRRLSGKQAARLQEIIDKIRDRVREAA